MIGTLKKLKIVYKYHCIYD